MFQRKECLKDEKIFVNCFYCVLCDFIIDLTSNQYFCKGTRYYGRDYSY